MQTTTHRETTTNAGIDKLQECLRGELSAVETYELALKNVTHVSVHQTLQEIFVNHSRRTDQLRDKIRRLGAEPATSSGVWGAFAKVFQAGADLLGDRTAIAALEEGEDRMLKVYTTDLEDCDAGTRKFIETDLLTAQQHTHELCRSLKNYMKTAS